MDSCELVPEQCSRACIWPKMSEGEERKKNEMMMIITKGAFGVGRISWGRGRERGVAVKVRREMNSFLVRGI